MKIAKTMPLTIVAVLSLSEISYASTERIPDIKITVIYKARGAVHVVRALSSAATAAGLTCTPSIKEVDRGWVAHYKGKEITLHSQMWCISPSNEAVDAVYTSPDQVELRAYYDLNFPRLSARGVIDGIIDRIKETLQVDPLISAIEQTANVNSRPVVSRIK